MRRTVTMGCLWCVAVVTTACGASESGELKRRLSSLEEELATLQSAQDRLEDDLAGLRAARDPGGPRASAARASSADHSQPGAERPLLEVVKLTPTPGSSGSAPHRSEPSGTKPSTTAPTRLGAGNGAPAAPGAAGGPEAAAEDGAPRPVIRGSGDKIEGKNFDQPTSALEPTRKCDAPLGLRQDPSPARRT